ncbi:MAG: BamA/TamA family outer membrane protein [Pyrinomonadaceae bacterium]|nr:BamA/TamA family outer membrane protein [Pyrinomonadaceae bacterium]MBP6211403.1 BamA/TamA family outer membrane protein [Pyrinomonadaceae bacterium]
MNSIKQTEPIRTSGHTRPGVIPFACSMALLLAILTILTGAATAQNKYERMRIDKVDITFNETDINPPAAENYRGIIKEIIGATYSTAKIHDSIQAVYKTKKVSLVQVSAELNNTGGVDLTYLIRLKPLVQKVSILLDDAAKRLVTEQELLFKLNLLEPGTAITEQSLSNNADQILDYLREHGFYRSEVTFEQKPIAGSNAVDVVFKVSPNAQTKIAAFVVRIDGLAEPIPQKEIKLQPGSRFTREKLTNDIASIRNYLRKKDFAAPELDDPKVSYDSDADTISIELDGKVGPVVKVSVESEKLKVGDSTLNRLLPIKREGTLDFAAIVEGERRLENYFQEKGYFFADVSPVCSVDPPLNLDGTAVPNNTEFVCSSLGSSDLRGRTVNVIYRLNENRRLRLVSLRIRGTDRLPIEEIRTVFESQEANALGIIPVLGYGRGFTSLNILERDAATIRSLMNELGYRDAQVRVNQGVSPNGEDLIITFQVDEGAPTMVASVNIVGNNAISSDELKRELPKLAGLTYSRARVRNAVRKISEIYSNAGFYDARITSAIIDSPAVVGETKHEIKVELRVETEGRRVVINRVLVSGNKKTKSGAILKAATLKPGAFLRAADVYGSELSLYSTDAFDRVVIKPEPAGDTPAGDKAVDVLINVNEQPPRLLTYGGGYSTDLGLNGFFDIRHVNLLGNLWQGGARVRWSQFQQIVQFDFINPRFFRDGEKRFAPLTFSAEYQRDATVTRFFRSAFDKGTFGIVQRIDADGNPIDVLGGPAGSPTINRLLLTAETSRTLSRKKRSILFARYRFEDVRLSNIDSLLIKDLLEPDKRVRISGFGFTYVRDTRENCSVKFTLLDLIAKGELGDPCRYNASDPTRGSYITAEYNISLPLLGANIGFQKFQASYNIYYTFPWLKNTTLAGRAILGLATVFSSGDRFQSAQFPGLEGILPISERFFAGGSNTLRGFDFEEAGPRVVIVPQGTYLNSAGNQVYLDPFTIPFGGNALAVINLEARIPISKSVRVVPFYDGGNVFARIGDIFNPPDVPPNDVFRRNLRALWSHTAGIGLRLKTPVGGEFGIDYGRLLNPPRFLIPQTTGPNATYQLRQDQIHFRFSQAF